MAYRVPKAAADPLALEVDVLSPLVDTHGRATQDTAAGTQSVDLTSANVTAASIAYQRQDGTQGTWTATIVSQPASSTVGDAYSVGDYVRVRHVWDAADLPDVERISVIVILTTTAGDVPCSRVVLDVYDPYRN